MKPLKIFVKCADHHNNIFREYKQYNILLSIFPEDVSGPKIQKNKDVYCGGEVECMKRGGD